MEDIELKFTKAEEFSDNLNSLINSQNYAQAYQLYLSLKNDYSLSFYYIPPKQGNQGNN